jgi:hypothetical protein
MAVIAQRTLQTLRDWNTSFWAEVSQNANIPQSVKSMIYQHIQSLWITDALAVVISPLKNGEDPYLKQSAFDIAGIQYYYPSVDFWMAHAQQSHPPAGQGCDPEVHAAFLTRGGKNAEFQYAVVKKDGSLIVQDLNGFVTECAFYLSGTRE